MRKEATFAGKGKRCTDFKNKAIKPMLPLMLFDVDYCYGNERNVGFMSSRRKHEKSPRDLQAQTSLWYRNTHLKIILTGSGNQTFGFWRGFSWLLILACTREFHQEECWKRVLQLLANTLTVF